MWPQFWNFSRTEYMAIFVARILSRTVAKKSPRALIYGRDFPIFGREFTILGQNCPIFCHCLIFCECLIFDRFNAPAHSRGSGKWGISYWSGHLSYIKSHLYTKHIIKVSIKNVHLRQPAWKGCPQVVLTPSRSLKLSKHTPHESSVKVLGSTKRFSCMDNIIWICLGHAQKKWQLQLTHPFQNS